MSTYKPLSALVEALHRFEPTWLEVGRIYRRMCVLRTEGHAVEAQLIEQNEFADALARVRETSGSDSDSLLKAFLAAEEVRVADAVVLAEVLVPILAKRLSTLAPAPRVASAASAAASLATRERKAGHDENRGIADFIDDMLSQDSTGVR